LSAHRSPDLHPNLPQQREGSGPQAQNRVLRRVISACQAQRPGKDVAKRVLAVLRETAQALRNLI
jgi:hypothetical protein